MRIERGLIFGWFKMLLTVVAIIYLIYILLNNADGLVSAYIHSPLLLISAIAMSVLSLFIQALGFKSIREIYFIPLRRVLSIWNVAILVNHVFPFAGGLGYRYLALKEEGVSTRQTTLASIRFLISSVLISLMAVAGYWVYGDTPYIVEFLAFCPLALWAVYRVGGAGAKPGLIFAHVIQAFVMAWVVYLAACSAGLELDYWQCFAIAALMRLGTVVSLTPAGMGVQELIIVGGVFALTGTDGEQLALLVRINYLISAGVLALITYKR